MFFVIEGEKGIGRNSVCCIAYIGYVFGIRLLFLGISTGSVIYQILRMKRI